MAIKIDEMRKTLVITAGFKKKASVFNREEYTLLRQAKNENPGFKVEVRKAKRKNSPKLTLDFMRRYIDDLPDTEKKVNHKKAYALSVFNRKRSPMRSFVLFVSEAGMKGSAISR